MDRHYMHPHMYRFSEPQQSYWEATAGDLPVDAPPLATRESCDIAVIGGGYTGLSAAYHLARDYGADVRVLEAGHIGWGASGRNAGFCCVGGSALSGAQLLKHYGDGPAREYYRSTVAAVELVRDLLDDEDIDAGQHGDAEFVLAHSPAAALRLEQECAGLPGRLGADVEYLPADAVRERLFTATEAFGAKQHRPGFGLHPLRYCRGLAAAARRRGALLHAHSRVVDWSRDADGLHRLATAGGELRARKVIYACNGFMEDGLNAAFNGRFLPIVSAIIVTRPLTAAELGAQRWQTENTFSTSRRVLNYFRLLSDHRLLFGGRGQSIGDPGGESAAYRDLTAGLDRLFPAWDGIDVDYQWHGLVCFSSRLLPVIGALPDDPSVYYGFAYHGNGVSEASWSGKQLADWIGRGRIPDTLPQILSVAPARFPLARFRRRYFRAALLVAKWQDRLLG